MTVTATGLVTKRFPDIQQELETALIDASGNPNLDLSDSSVLGILNTVYAASAAEGQDLIQAVYSAGDIDRAEGIVLDNLVSYIGLTRLKGKKSNGFIYFTSTNIPDVIASGTKVVSVNRDVALTTNVTRIDTALCYDATLDFTVVNSAAYTININGVAYTYTSDSSATKAEIANGLSAAITSVVCTTVVTTDNRLRIVSVSSGNTLAISLITGNMSVFSATKRTAAEAEGEGVVEFEALSINRLETPRNGVSVVNLQSFTIGSSRETDEELRARHAASTQLVGLRTEAAIVARVLAIEGVTKATIRDNVLDTTDAVTGLPAHSFEVVVKGGGNTEVAEAILYTKSAGIQTFGNVAVNVTDNDGVTRTINFSRPEDVIVWVKVQYELYDEEVVPSDIENLIKEQVLDYGEALEVGEDVIPTRFLPNLYKNISGLGKVIVSLATTVDDLTPPTSYAENTIPIGEFEESRFTLARILTEEIV